MPLKEFAFLHANFSLRKPFFPSIFQRDWNAKTSGTFMWRIRVNAHSSHVYISWLPFFFHFYIPRLALCDETRKWRKGTRKVDPSVRSRENYRRKKQETGSILAMGSSLTSLERELTNNFSLFHLIIWIHSRVDPLEK